MIKLPPLALQQAETAAGAVVLRRRRRRRRSGDGLLTDAPADDEKPEWARVLEATLDAERQRGEVRAWICKDGVDEHSDACHVRRDAVQGSNASQVPGVLCRASEAPKVR